MARRKEISIASIYHSLWTIDMLDQAFVQLATYKGWSNDLGIITKPPTSAEQDGREWNHWLDNTANRLRMEVEPTHITYQKTMFFIERGGPAIIKLPSPPDIFGTDQRSRFLVLLTYHRRQAVILGSDGQQYRLSPDTVKSVIWYSQEAEIQAEVSKKVGELAEIGREDQLVATIRQARLAHLATDQCWLMRLDPSVPIIKKIQNLGLDQLLVVNTILQILYFGFTMGAWVLVEKIYDHGEIRWAWLIATCLILITSGVFMMPRQWLDRMYSTPLSSQLLKQHLFYGVLQLDLEEIRLKGLGQFLAWVLQSNAIERGGIMGGSMILFNLISLLVIDGMLFLTGTTLLCVLLLLWLILTLLIIWRITHHYIQLDLHYSAMNNNFLERIQGHRTRLVQEKEWFEADDKDIATYIPLVSRYEDWMVRFITLIPTGWVFIGLSVTIFMLIFTETPITNYGVIFAALLFGQEQFKQISIPFNEFVKAYSATVAIDPILKAAGRSTESASPEATLTQSLNGKEEREVNIIEGRNLTFRYHAGGRLILDSCNFKIKRGSRILLEGPSGGGKSTLASLLVGLNEPSSGLLLLQGLDRHTLSSYGWRQQVIAAPQFHENHIMSSSLAFNLLMGRQWPPNSADLTEAETICRELGLAELLDSMPLGLMQPVGERGWQLSHGERSRVYIARALLQQAKVVILDESFASLDPENMRIALETVLKRTDTLLVIAHP